MIWAAVKAFIVCLALNLLTGTGVGPAGGSGLAPPGPGCGKTLVPLLLGLYGGVGGLASGSAKAMLRKGVLLACYTGTKGKAALNWGEKG